MTSACPIDLAYVHEASDGDVAFEHQLLNVYLRESQILARALFDAHERGHQEAFVRSAHSLKSMLRTVGAAEAVSFAAALEHSDPADREIPSRLAALTELLSAVEHSVRAVLAGTP